MKKEFQTRLVHMLGAGPEVRKSRRGYRNHFAATIGGAEHAIMTEMVAAGLVKAGCIINDGGMQYFHATVEGCKAAGLGQKATDTATENFRE